MRTSQPWLTNRSRLLRANEVKAESKLWFRLRNRQLGGFKFVRQEPIGPFFADFICRECKLVVEVDGGTHGTDAERAADEGRSEFLRRLGYRIVRAWNFEIKDNMGGVLETIIAALNAPQDVQAECVAAPHPGPLPVKDGERESRKT